MTNFNGITPKAIELLSENRFKLLAKTNKEGFEKLLEEAQKDVWHRWNLYQSIAGMGADKPAE